MEVWYFNKGEWTEAYVFLRLLGEGRIYGASADLIKDEMTFIDIVNVIRDEPNHLLVFERFLKEEQAYIVARESDCKIKIITAPELKEKASFLYNAIKAATSDGSRVISVPSIQEYLEELRITSPKANLSDSALEKFGKKTDIILTTKDSHDHAQRQEGFSIKSHLGSSPTLFNSSSSSGFTFEIVGCDKDGVNLINMWDDYLKMITFIKAAYEMKYIGCRDEVFEDNLMLVDCCLVNVLSQALLISAGYYSEETYTSTKDICNKLIELNPLNIRHPELFYPAKIKNFLFASFAGLTASTLWSGRKMLTGGYIDVDKQGDMLYYRAISDDVFCNYLFENTYFDRPDRGYMKDLAVARSGAALRGTSLTEDEIERIEYTTNKKTNKKSKKAKKGNFGYAYERDGHCYFDINFQVRFR